MSLLGSRTSGAKNYYSMIGLSLDDEVGGMFWSEGIVGFENIGRLPNIDQLTINKQFQREIDQNWHFWIKWLWKDIIFLNFFMI